MLIALIILAAWVPLPAGLALVLGRVLRERDRH